MSAHSPGPWRLVPFPALDRDVVVGADGSDVAHVVTGHSDERRAVDGRLIEAADELLDLARYVAERGEGGAEQARALIARIEAGG